ncbi:3-keto-disaccharide hydrolase [Coraliomargarita sp. W4R53]
MNYIKLCLLGIIAIQMASANTLSKSQINQYNNRKDLPFIIAPEDAMLNTDPEPDLSNPGFVQLYNGKNLDGWKVRGGTCSFEAHPDKIIGKTVPGSPNTFLCLEREDYDNFIFSVELYWEVNSNSGVMIRSSAMKSGQKERIVGPQIEMEGFQPRGWSGGIYGEGVGGWIYPLWLDAHEKVRNSLKEGQWNRITILANGPVIKTWLNGEPAANWETDKYTSGLIGLQIHAGKTGEVHFRNPIILEPKN